MARRDVFYVHRSTSVGEVISAVLRVVRTLKPKKKSLYQGSGGTVGRVGCREVWIRGGQHIKPFADLAINRSPSETGCPWRPPSRRVSSEESEIPRAPKENTRTTLKWVGMPSPNKGRQTGGKKGTPRGDRV